MTQTRLVAALLMVVSAISCVAAVAQTVTALTPDRAETPLPTGQAVTWTADVTGGTDPWAFQFWRFDASTGWLVVQDYGMSPSYTWTPATADAGKHVLQVWVRNAGSAARR